MSLEKPQLMNQTCSSTENEPYYQFIPLYEMGSGYCRSPWKERKRHQLLSYKLFLHVDRAVYKSIILETVAKFIKNNIVSMKCQLTLQQIGYLISRDQECKIQHLGTSLNSSDRPADLQRVMDRQKDPTERQQKKLKKNSSKWEKWYTYSDNILWAYRTIRKVKHNFSWPMAQSHLHQLRSKLQH